MGLENIRRWFLKGRLVDNGRRRARFGVGVEVVMFAVESVF